MPTKLVYNSETENWDEIELTPQEVTFLKSNPPQPTPYINSDEELPYLQFSTYFIDTGNGDVSITLPDPIGGGEATFIKTSSENTMNLLGDIQGQESLSITDVGSISVISDNSNWWIK